MPTKLIINGSIEVELNENAPTAEDRLERLFETGEPMRVPSGTSTVWLNPRAIAMAEVVDEPPRARARVSSAARRQLPVTDAIVNRA